MPKPLLLAMALSCFVYTVFCMHLPVALLADAMSDDGLFVQHGLSIISGHWLGPYSQMTLPKGPGYPLFLALNAELGVPITLSQALLYCAACLLIGRAIYRLADAPWLALFCFLAIQWHPALFPARITRDDISAAQVLLVLAAIWHCVFVPGRLRHRLLWAAFGGLILGWFWLTREDAIWVVPGLLILFLFQALRLLRRGRALLRLGSCAVTLLVAALATLGLVAAINLHVYGTFATTDFSSPAFEKAVNTMQAVHVGQPVPFVPVPAKVRQAIDRVSPAFESLEPYLNGPGRGWTQPGCAVYPSTCGDFAGGWFVWALRDAAAAEGHYSSPKAAARFYRQIGQQVGAACASGRLHCRPNPIPFMPAVTRSQWARLPHELLKMYQIATWQPDMASWDLAHRFLHSSGDPTQLATMERFLRYPRRTSATSEPGAVRVDGWFRAPAAQWLGLACSNGSGETILPVARLPNADHAAVSRTGTADEDRFSITTPGLDGCALESEVAGKMVRLDLAALGTGTVAFAGGTLAVNDIEEAGAEGQTAVAMLRMLDVGYSHVLSVGTIASILVFCITILWRLIRRRRALLDPVAILILSLWTLLLARAAILVLVEISSFPAINPLYWSPGFPLLCLAIILSLALPFLRSATGSSVR